MRAVAVDAAPVHPVLSSWAEALRLLQQRPVLFLPLGLAAVPKLALITLALLAPFEPFSRVLAPAVRYFFGEIFLHYPYHLALATRLLRPLDMFGPVLLDGFLIGVTAYLCAQLVRGTRIRVWEAISRSAVRYPAILLIAALSAGLLFAGMRAMFWGVSEAVQQAPSFWVRNQFLLSFLISLGTVVLASLVESLLVFAIPVCVVERRSWLKALAKSARIASRHYGPVFLALFATSLAYLPLLLLRQDSTKMVTAAWPEAIFGVYALRVALSWWIGVLFAVWGTVFALRVSEGGVR